MTDNDMLATFRADNGIGIGDAEQALECLLGRAAALASSHVSLHYDMTRYSLRDSAGRVVARGGTLEALARDLFARFPEVTPESDAA